MQKILKLTVILFAICAIVAGILGVVYNITEPSIQAQADAKEAAAYAAVMESNGFEDVDADFSGFSGIDKVVRDKEGKGWVVTTTFSGAQGSITMMVGVDSDYKCTGISITEASETPGLGAVYYSDTDAGVNFRSQFVGVDDTITIADIDYNAGASLTATAVVKAVANCIAAVESIG